MFQHHLLSLAVLLLSITMSDSPDFKMIKKDGPIVLYERWIHHRGNDVRELKAEFFVESNPQKLVQLLQNETIGTKWNDKASSYKILQNRGKSNWVNYIKYDMPFLMDDQDCCLSFTLNRLSAKVYRIDFSSSENTSFPVKANTSRITGVKGKWIIEQQTGERCKVIYLISSDRNKNIPRMVSDPIVRSNLISTMKKVKTLLEQ